MKKLNSLNQSDIELAKIVLNSFNYSLVVVKEGRLLGKKRERGIKPFLKVINELGKNIENATVGDRIVGRAIALLSLYVKIKEIYTPLVSQKAIEVLKKEKIGIHADKIVPYIKNREGTGVCPFEKLLIRVNSPQKAFKLVKDKLGEL
ncbi:MAG: DUF1893 domain-containing protein [Candidatus Aerophobetes bacterium]|nr:DUF1893 domain-containing protein [Candidatus Aerophobetes bacterium]